jgi:two-component system response regulator HydG
MFREDLYYRLNVIKISIPPLRQRREDIEPLAEYFLRKYEGKTGKRFRGFSPGAMELLIRYDWPGNVRELENVIERASILSEADAIGPGDLSIPSHQARPEAARGHSLPPLQEVEKEHILKLLKQTGGNQTRASRLLGIDRKTLYLKMKKYGITA